MSPEQTPPTDEQIRMQATCDALVAQRNQAMNALAQAEAQIAVLAHQLKTLETEEPHA